MSAEKKLKEAIRKLNMCEEFLFSRREFERGEREKLGVGGTDVVLELIYEKTVSARDLIIEAMEVE